MDRHLFLAASILACLAVSGCIFGAANYGKVKNLSGDRKIVTIDNLIKNWEDYDVYYAGLGIRHPLGLMFDPKDNHTKLTGDRWQKIVDQESLLEAARWIRPHTQFLPSLVQLLGPDNQFLGYLYYAWGPVVLKKVDDSTFYVLDLEDPNDIRVAD